MYKRVYNNVNILKVITSYLGHDVYWKFDLGLTYVVMKLRICETWSLGPLKEFYSLPN